MRPKAIDSLDFVEAVMALEEVLGIEIPADDAEQCGSPREMVDLLEHHLSNQHPGAWRREQIAAIVRELFRD